MCGTRASEAWGGATVNAVLPFAMCNESPSMADMIIVLLLIWLALWLAWGDSRKRSGDNPFLD